MDELDPRPVIAPVTDIAPVTATPEDGAADGGERGDPDRDRTDDERTPAPTAGRPPHRRLSRVLLGVLAISLVVLGGSVVVARRAASHYDEAQAARGVAQSDLEAMTETNQTTRQRLDTVRQRMAELDDIVAASDTDLTDVARLADESNALTQLLDQALRSNSFLVFDARIIVHNAKIDEYNAAIDRLYASLQDRPQR
jgi:hypothetical protein